MVTLQPWTVLLLVLPVQLECCADTAENNLAVWFHSLVVVIRFTVCLCKLLHMLICQGIPGQGQSGEDGDFSELELMSNVKPSHIMLLQGRPTSRDHISVSSFLFFLLIWNGG